MLCGIRLKLTSLAICLYADGFLAFQDHSLCRTVGHDYKILRHAGEEIGTRCSPSVGNRIDHEPQPKGIPRVVVQIAR